MIRRTALFALVCLLSACAQREESQRFTDIETVRMPFSSPLRVPASDAQWSNEKLPHLIRTAPNFFPGSSAVPWDTHWHRIHVERPAQNGQQIERKNDLAIYIPRVRWPRLKGRLDVFINQQPVDTSSIVWNSPILVNIPKEKTPDGSFDVLIALSLERGQSGALSRVWIGSAEELQVRFAWREFLQQRVPQVTGISFAILGLFSFLFWLARRSEWTYLLFAIAAALNVLRNAHYYFVNPESLGDGFWWLIINSLAWWMLAAHLFAVRLHGQRFPLTEKALIGGVSVVTLGSLFAVMAGVTIERWGPLAYLSQIVVGLMVPMLCTIGAWRTRSRTALLVTVVLWLNVFFGVHDFLLTNWRVSPESVILLPYGAMAVLGVFIASIGQRYLEAIRGTEQLNLSLEQRLSERSRALEESHRRLRLIEQEQAVVDERQRLMREMHDGLGSALMSSLVMVEHGKLNASQMAEVLRESIDDLKLTIDSLEPMGNDLLTLLGTLRYRLGKRLEAAGFALEWKVEETPPLPWLNPTSALQILRILQEALTNTLKHSRANAIRVETWSDDETVSIRLTDNGIGFDMDEQKNSGGRGLKNLQRRAETLGARVYVESQAGQTAVTLVLRRERRTEAR